MSQTWMLVVPVKPLARAKSRLSGPAGPHRAELALAVATDTVSAALRCSRVRGVLVVTDDPIDAPGLRRDVDTIEDLRAALALGVGPRTASVASLLQVA